MEENEIKKIKETTEDLLNKMTITDFIVEPKEGGLNLIDLNIKLKEPQILIGSDGQTLFELQRVLRIALNKKLKKNFYLELDINDYKKKKIEYIKNSAKNLADEVSLTKEKKVLSPMPAYQRRIIHTELSQRQGIVTESQGDGADRHIIIRPS